MLIMHVRRCKREWSGWYDVWEEKGMCEARVWTWKSDHEIGTGEKSGSEKDVRGNIR